MKSFIKENFIIIIIILILFSYLELKALNPYGWDGWGFGSAQTLMSSEYWAKDGFAKNYFLFIPRPYSQLIHYLDNPEFLNRQIDNAGGALIRNRVYYTHYPPLYLFPYALITKLGFENRAVFRIFSIIISLLALFLFYLFVKSVSGRSIAVIASIYYGFSVTFLNYADSVSTQPSTIFFTFLILLLSVLAARNYENNKIYAKYNAVIWLFYLILSLSSFDTTFFIFAWLVLYDVIILKKFLWQKWLFFISAPVLGFILQIFQNVWYLGWNGTLNDIYSAYIARAIGSLKNFILGLVAPFVSMTSLETISIFKKTVVALLGSAAIFGILCKLRTKNNLGSNYFKMVFILAIAAVVQPFFINVTGHWPYQGVLTAPFWGLLIGTSGIFIINTLKQKELKIYKMPSFLILMALILIFLSSQFYATFVYAKDWPNNKPNQKVIEFSKEIKNLYSGKEKIALRMLPDNPIWKSQFPILDIEYYLGMPLIDFANTKDLLTDFWWLRNHSEYPYYSFIIAENKSDALKIRQELAYKNIKNISDISNIQGQYVFTVGQK